MDTERAAVTSSTLVTVSVPGKYSSLNQVRTYYGQRPHLLVFVNGSTYSIFLRFYTSKHALLGNIPEKKIRDRKSVYEERKVKLSLQHTTMHVLHTHTSRRPHIPFPNLKAQSVPYSHTLRQLPKPPNSCHISPATQLKQCRGGAGGTALPLIPAQRRHREAACPADQWLNFILNGTQHPRSMKWSLIIKLKSLSAEQFKWRHLSALLLLCLYLSLSLQPPTGLLCCSFEGTVHYEIKCVQFYVYFCIWACGCQSV